MTTEDRVLLNDLSAKKKFLNQQIANITVHPRGVPYSKLLCDLVHRLIRDTHEPMETYKEYGLYNKMRGAISRELGIKTQVYTRQEYIYALNTIEKRYNYKIPEEFKVKENMHGV